MAKKLEDWQVEDARRLKALFEERAKQSQLAFGAAHDIGNQSMVSQYLLGVRPLNIVAATKFAKGLGVSIDAFSPTLAQEVLAAWLQTDAGKRHASVIPLRAHKPGGLVDMDHADDPFPMRMQGLPDAPWEGGKTTKQIEREHAARPFSIAKDVVANVGPGEPHAANDKFEKVPELADVRLAAGDGIENDNELITGMIQFRASFLRSVGADKGRGRVVYAKGDSMEPVIKDGAALLVVPNESLTLRDLAAGGVYAINYDGKMLVKTVTRDKLTGRWVARSVNPKYPDVPLEGEASVRVLGKVVWAGARLRDDEAGQWVRS